VTWPVAAPSWQLLVGGNPVPGDVTVVETQQRRIADASARVAQAVTTLDAIGGLGSAWCGPGAAAFRGAAVDELRTRLDDLRGAYDGVSAALRAYVPELMGHLQEAAAIARRAEEAAASATPTDPFLTATVTTTYRGVPAALVPVQQDRDALAHRATASAQRCAKAITAAVKPVKAYEPGNAQKLGRWLTDEIDGLNSALRDASKWISLVALVTMPIPGVGEITNAINIAVNVVILTTDLVLWTQDRRTGSDIVKGVTDVAVDMAGVGAAKKTASAVREVNGAKAAANQASSDLNRARAAAYDARADKLAELDGTPAAVTSTYSRIQAQASRNRAELDGMAADYYKGLAEARPTKLQQVKTGLGESRAQLREDGYNPVATYKNLFQEWRLPADHPGRPWRDLEMSIQAYSTGDAWSKDNGTENAAPPLQPTGWRG
jgi:hypothetical protein